jgi:hypothetical protein
MRARDLFAATIEERKAQASRRGTGIPTADQFLAMERTAAALGTFPELAEEIKRLVRGGKIPTTTAGGAFVEEFMTSLVDENRPYLGGDEGVRAALRAQADLRLFFQAEALPAVRDTLR